VATIEQEAARAAREVGIDPRLYVALITKGERSHKGWQRSPAGAFGPAQLMPATAAALGKKYKINVNTRYGNLLGGAHYLREQLSTFGGNRRKALAAYNAGPGNVQKYGGVPPFAETQRYVRNVLGSLGQVKVPKDGGERSPPTGAPPPTLTGPLPPPPGGVLGMDLRTTALGNMGRIAMGEQPTDVLADLVRAAQMPPPVAAVTPPRGTDLVDPRGKKVTKAVTALDPGGGWGGSYGPATALAEIGRAAGLSAVSEKRDRRSTSSGGVSDHWVGSKNSYAYDLSNGSRPTAEMDRAAIRIARRLGVKYNGKGPLVLTKTIGGYRYQVLYRTQVGGNHNDHIHVGVSRVGGKRR
jgi:hypothetical protein